MKNIILLILCSLTFMACSTDDDSVPVELYYPSAMIVYCQASSDAPLKTVRYKYAGDKLLTETTMQNGELESKTTFDYNSQNQIISEVYFSDSIKIEKTFVYNENNQLINILYKFSNYDSDGQIIDESESEAPREYENNQLIKEWEYWGGFSTYEYSNGKLATRIDYTKNAEKHHIITYKYANDFLIEEQKETKLGSLIYQKSFEYDSQNRLVIIRDGENIIEENKYAENKLLEKRTNYFGIDPGFDVCYGNYIYKFEY